MITAIEKIAAATRKALCHSYGDDTLEARCLQCSQELAQRLNKAGFDARLVMGTFAIDSPDPACYDEWCEDDFDGPEDMDDAMHNPLHYWVTIKGMAPIIDITASQFNYEIDHQCDHMPHVFIGSYEDSGRHNKRRVSRTAGARQTEKSPTGTPTEGHNRRRQPAHQEKRKGSMTKTLTFKPKYTEYRKEAQWRKPKRRPARPSR